MGTTSEFRTGNTRPAVLKLFTGEVERMTNYDRMKSMSVEEMAKETTILFYKVKDYTNAEHYIKQWLEQEVE